MLSPLQLHVDISCKKKFQGGKENKKKSNVGMSFALMLELIGEFPARRHASTEVTVNRLQCQVTQPAALCRRQADDGLLEQKLRLCC